MYIFINYFKKNFRSPLEHLGFRDPVTSLMENIIDLYHFIFFFIIVISGLVLWLILPIVNIFIFLYLFYLMLTYHLDVSSETSLNESLNTKSKSTIKKKC